MPKICYTPRKFSASSQELIDIANGILEEYEQQGYQITLRTLYYQCVSRDILPNNDKEYDRLGSIINDARWAGKVDWLHLTDRTRNLRSVPHWPEPGDIIESAAQSFRLDKWQNQDVRVECFTPDTPVFMPDGVAPIGSLEVGDNVITHLGRTRAITEILRRPYKGVILRIRADGVLPITLTMQHPLWVRRQGKDACSWVKAHKLRTGDYLTLPRLAVPDQPTNITTYITMPGGKQYQPLIGITVDRSFLRLCGTYLAEGNIRSDGRTVQLTFNQRENEAIDLVCAWAQEQHISTHTTIGPGVRVLLLYSKTLASWLAAEFGNGSYVKRLPEWFINLPIADQSVLLQEYIHHDGHTGDKTRSAIVVSTRSQTLASQVHMLLIRAGYGAALQQTMDHGKLIYRVSVSGTHGEHLAQAWSITLPPRIRHFSRIKIDADCAYFPVRSIEQVEYEGDVCNLEVEEDHSYCASIAAHNCWVEKDALAGVVERVCTELDVPWFSARGYSSVSEFWVAAQRLSGYADEGQKPIIFHLGDHDPSGKDMTRDIERRINILRGRSGDPHTNGEDCDLDQADIPVYRLALNMDQIRQYDPPPNPAKLTDARARAYIAEYGNFSWELDALAPSVLDGVIREAILGTRDEDRWIQMVKDEQKHRKQLAQAAKQWNTIVERLEA